MVGRWPLGALRPNVCAHKRSAVGGAATAHGVAEGGGRRTVLTWASFGLEDSVYADLQCSCGMGAEIWLVYVGLGELQRDGRRLKHE